MLYLRYSCIVFFLLNVRYFIQLMLWHFEVLLRLLDYQLLVSIDYHLAPDELLLVRRPEKHLRSAFDAVR